MVGKCAVLAVLGVLCGCVSVKALYEDEAGQNDWHLIHVGNVKVAAFSEQDTLVGTEQGVLGAIGNDGSLVWRQVIPTDAGTEFTSKGFRALTSKGSILGSLSNDGCTLRVWNPTTGGLNWDADMCIDGNSGADALLLVEDVSKDTTPDVVLLSGNTVNVYSGFNGELLTTWTGPENVKIKDIVQIDTRSLAAFGNRKEGGVEAFKVELTGPTVKEERWTLATKATENFSAVGKSIVIEDAESKKISICYLLSRKCSPSTVAVDVIKSISSDPEIATILIGDSIYSVVDGKLALLFQSESTSVSASQGGVVGIAQKVTDETCGPVEVLEWFILSSEKKYSIQFPEEVGRRGERGAVVGLFVQGSGTTAKVLTVFEDQSVVMIQLWLDEGKVESKVLYIREEALADVVNVGSVELPAVMGDLDDSFAEQAANIFTHGNFMSIFLFRLQDQVRALRSLFTSLIGTAINFVKRAIESRGEILTSSKSPGYSDSALTSFGFRRGILMQSRCGKVFLVNALSGDIMYSFFDASNKGQDTKMYVTRTHGAGSSHPAEVVFVNLNSGKMTWRNALTGVVLKIENHGQPISEAFLISGEQVHKAAVESGSAPEHPDEEDVAPAGFVVAIDQSMRWRAHPEEKHKWLLAHDSLFKSIHAVHMNMTSGALVGLSLAADNSVHEMWSLVVPENDELLSVQAHSGGAVSNPGIIQPDQSVLVKYLNPNMIMLATRNEANEVIVTIVDGVSGRILKRLSHKNGEGPVHSVLYDNTLVYSFWNALARRTEVSVVGLYDGEINKRELNMWTSREETAPGSQETFSSFEMDQPSLSQRTYFVENSICAMGVTSTRLGITARRVFFGYESGSLNMQLPQLLDPRRPSKVSAQEKAVGMTEYFPQLHAVPTFTISYNLTVQRIKAIHSMPTKLESTTLVLATGLDLFFARVMPSMGFDVLNEDFSFALLILMVCGLLAGSVVLNKMVKARQLASAWM